MLCVCVIILTDGTGDVNTGSISTLHGIAVERLCQPLAANHSSTDRNHDQCPISLRHRRQVVVLTQLWSR